MKPGNYQETLRFLYSFLPKTNMEKFPGEYGLRRTRHLLQELGNPQESLRVIHIAGTSGKGSTAVITERLLREHGKRTGLHVKPHLLDVRERFQIDGKLITESQFVSAVNSMLPAIERTNSRGWGLLTYFEVLISLAYSIFEKMKVDYAVIETGVGGLFDGSNTVENPDKIAVITTIGYDHVPLLGNTLQEIAAQKAGIIRPGNRVFVLKQPLLESIFDKAAEHAVARIEYVEPEKVLNEYDQGRYRVEVEDILIDNVTLGLKGAYQRDNAAMALSAVTYAAKRDGFSLKPDLIKRALSGVRYRGRYDCITYAGKKLILDGAHNTQKIQSFLSSITEAAHGKKWAFILAFKQGKEIGSMLELIIPYASEIIVTDFFDNQADFVNISADPHEVASSLDRLGFRNYRTVYSAAKSLDLVLAGISSPEVICTGSLYFLADVYSFLTGQKKVDSIR
ncbi:MAG: Mur ligase family protein [Patescibacteria group bacterium]|nr:Mur ligase family protein [Patescibacteria group bacterium]